MRTRGRISKSKWDLECGFASVNEFDQAKRIRLFFGWYGFWIKFAIDSSMSVVRIWLLISNASCDRHIDWPDRKRFVHRSFYELRSKFILDFFEAMFIHQLLFHRSTWLNTIWSWNSRSEKRYHADYGGIFKAIDEMVLMVSISNSRLASIHWLYATPTTIRLALSWKERRANDDNSVVTQSYFYWLIVFKCVKSVMIVSGTYFV
jgi:hypothetical protein